MHMLLLSRQLMLNRRESIFGSGVMVRDSRKGEYRRNDCSSFESTIRKALVREFLTHHDL